MSISESPQVLTSSIGSFTPGASAPEPQTAEGPRLYRFSVEEYFRIFEAGIFSPHERLELLDGIVCMMSPIGPGHTTATDLLYRWLLKALPSGFDVSMQRDLLLTTSVPQPDLCVLRGSIRDFSSVRPSAADVILAIEVSDSSLQKDRVSKQAVYAAAGIPEYWILNLPERKLERFRKPVAAEGSLPARYEAVDVYAENQTISVDIGGVTLNSFAAKDFLP